MSICARFQYFRIVLSSVDVLLAVLVRLVAKQLGMEDHMEPGLVTYPSLTAFFSFTLWLVFFN